MTGAELQEYERRLEATGLHFAVRERDGGGNVIRISDLPWSAVIVTAMQRFGWCITDGEDLVGMEPLPSTHLTLEK